MSGALKVAGAVLLLASLTLPMSSCRVAMSQRTGSPDAGKPAPTATEYKYAVEELDPPALALFVWPVAAIAVLRWSRRRWLRGLTRVLEPLLLLGAFGVVYLLSFLSTRIESGGCAALTGLTLYALGTLRDDAGIFLDWRQRRRGRETDPPLAPRARVPRAWLALDALALAALASGLRYAADPQGYSVRSNLALFWLPSSARVLECNEPVISPRSYCYLELVSEDFPRLLEGLAFARADANGFAREQFPQLGVDFRIATAYRARPDGAPDGAYVQLLTDAEQRRVILDVYAGPD